MKKVLLVPDSHWPNVDIRAWRLMLKVAHDLRPETIVTLGDLFDFATVSSHAKSAKERGQNLIDEVVSSTPALNDLDKIPGVRTKIFIEGNHEFRFDRYINDRAPELFGVTSVDKLFRLKQRGWKFVPYKQHFKLGEIWLTHDLGKAGQNAHRDAALKFGGNAVIGHTHRLAYEVRGSAQGKPHVAAMFGWLGDPKAATYMHSINATVDWALGFGVAYVRENGYTYITPVPILPDYSVVVNGKLFKG